MKNYEFKAFTIGFKHLDFVTGLPWVRRILLAFSIIVCSSTLVNAQIRVGLLGKMAITDLMVSPTEGSYAVLNEIQDSIYAFRSDDAVSISAFENQVITKSVYGLNDTLKSVQLVGNGLNPTIKMRIGSDKKELVYFESLGISAINGKLRLVNTLNVDRYVSMVVQAEVGYGAAEEYYKIQSIICRTYAMRNLERHATSGFDLCDHEHCQVFSGLKLPTNEVIRATAATSGSVMVDPKNNLILSAFHANCGGQTANSEDVWKESRTYLTSVKDTFCLGERSATWSKTISLSEFLSQIGLPINEAEFEGKSFNQPNRNKYLKLGLDSVETAKMRQLLGLRSAFFNLDVEGGKVKLYGRGYGHGVGICQQGAMKMAKTGYTYSQILGYYYKGVSLVPISALQVEK